MTGRADSQQPIQPRKPEKIGLPNRLFLYTLDQISGIIEVDEARLRASYVYYEGRSIGVAARDQIVARNIAPPGDKPEWRVAEQEFLRWLRRKGFRHYDRGFLGY